MLHFNSTEPQTHGSSYWKCKASLLGANHFTLGGGGGDFEKKNILQANMRKKEIPAQDHRPKKNSRTYSVLEKNYGKLFPVLTQ